MPYDNIGNLGGNMLNNSFESPVVNYPDVLGPKHVSEILGVGYSKALELVKSGAIPCVRIGNHYKISKNSLVEWLEKPGYREYL